MKRGWYRAALVLALMLTPAACSDEGPRGPGTWEGLVRSSTAPAGAVILEIRGTGIRDVEGVEPARAFTHRTSEVGSDTDMWRVVLVTSTPGAMAFRVAVDDLGDDAPRAVVVAAVDGEDQPLTGISSFSVEMGR